MAAAAVTADVNSWQSECGEVRVRLSAMLTRGLWTDCELAAGAGEGAERVPAHRVLLASASPVLAAMLYGSMPASHDQPLPLPDVDPKIARLLLEYIYTDNIVLESCEIACSLYRASHFLLIPHLAIVCKTYLENNVSPECVLRVYEFAQLFDEIELMEKCLKVMGENTSLVLESVGTTESPRVETLVRLFALPELNVHSELELLQAADRWAQQRAKETHLQAGNKEEEAGEPQEQARDIREQEGCAQHQTGDAQELAGDVRSMLQPALQQIRFLGIDPDDFTQYDVSPLLSQSELVAILYNLLSAKSKLPMPTGFNTSREPRQVNKQVIAVKIPVPKRENNWKSDTIYVQGVPWRLDISQERIDVDCNWGSEISEKLWHCDAKLTLKVWHPKQADIGVIANCRLKKGDFYHRFSWEQLSWSEVENPKNGYVVDGAVTVKLLIDAQPPVFE